MSGTWKPRTLILQHEAPTPPGLMTAWLAAQGAQVQVLRIDEADDEVKVGDYDLIVSLGSEFAAFDDSIHFVPREVRVFQDALDADVPILGLCFGGQMLARVLGSRLFRSEQAEIGWLPVRTHDAELVSTGPWFQWHFDSFTPPPGATLIAETDAAPQAFVAGRSLGLQFHPEVTPEIMTDWVRAYPHELEAEGVDPQRLLAETQRRAADAKRTTWRLLDRFRDRIALRRPSKERTG
jgi:GMP synthase-like glutamine amidotransferase